jgi:tetratricopeptide (TPR) repeat protein/predicted Ser/Thr protein kinase
MSRELNDYGSADSPEGVFASPADRVAALLDLGTSAADGATRAASSAGDESAPDVPGYEIITRLGEGGMGTVWRAVQRSTRREVALKLVAHGGASIGSHRARLRFDREVELAARLEHPNIARVYDSGMNQGVYYYAMELVEGRHLDQYVRDEKLDPKQVLSLMRDVCHAVQHAHQRGVIHRDLKPTNVLVTGDGTPKVLDFGLAKALDEAGDGPAGLTLTLEGQFAGTPAFMAPEQAAGDGGRRIDTRTDVYGLGATLYLLLTGQTPHDTAGPRLEVLRRVAEQEPRRPRQFDRRIDRDLEAILLTALARDPDRRYESTGALARDLENYLAGRPVAARRRSATYVLRKWVGRHRGPVAAAVLLAVLLPSLSAAGLYLTRRMAQQRQRGMDEGRLRGVDEGRRRGMNEGHLLTRATAQAKSGIYIEAAKGFDQAIDLGGQVTETWARSAYLHLVLGNRETYRRRCREIIERFGATKNPYDAGWAAEVCLAAPDSVVDWAPVVQLANRAYFDPAVTPMGASWYYIYKGMAEYRTGRMREALTWLAKAEPIATSRQLRATAAIRYFQAMAHYRLGERNAARERFLKACESYAADPTINSDYTDLFLMYLARTEAETLMGPDAPDPGWWKYHPPAGPTRVPALIQAEDFDEGGEGVGYYDYDGPNFFLGWNYRPATVDTEPCADEGGGWNIGGIRPGEWLAYTIAVPESAQYDAEFRVSSIWSHGQFRVELDGHDVTGPLTVPRTYDWQVYQTVTRHGVALPAGRHVVRLVFDRAGTGGDCVCNLNWLRVTAPGTE